MIKLTNILYDLICEGAYRPEQLSKAFDTWAVITSKNHLKDLSILDPMMGEGEKQRRFDHQLYYLTKSFKKKFIDLYSYMDNKDLFNMSREDLNGILDKAWKKREKKEVMKSKNLVDYIEIYEDDKIRIYVPLTYKGTCKLSFGTQWCTGSITTRTHFDAYMRGGILFRILYKNSDHKLTFWYQFNGKTDQFRDEKNRLVQDKNGKDISIKDFLPKEAWNKIQDYYEKHKKVVSEGLNLPKKVIPELYPDDSVYVENIPSNSAAYFLNGELGFISKKVIDTSNGGIFYTVLFFDGPASGSWDIPVKYLRFHKKGI